MDAEGQLRRDSNAQNHLNCMQTNDKIKYNYYC